MFTHAITRKAGCSSKAAAVRPWNTDPVTTTTGTVRLWNDDEGWGVLDSEATPGGCWAHFGSILADGFRSLRPGQAVSFAFHHGPQDGYDYAADAVWTGDRRPDPPAHDGTSAAYRSTLTLYFDPPA